MGTLRRRRRVATAALAVIVIGLSIVGCSSDDDSDEGAGDTVDDERPALMVLDGTDLGLEPSPTTDLDGLDRFGLSMALFGDPDAELWFADGDLSIWTSPTPEAVSATPLPAGAGDRSEQVTIRDDATAFVQAGSSDAGAPPTEATSAVAWAEQPDLGVAVVSTSLTTDELVDVAEAVEISGEGEVTLAEPPAGLDEVASIAGDQVSTPLWYVWKPTDTPALAVRYQPIEPGPQSVDLVTFTVDDPADADELLAYFRYRRPDATPTDIGGREDVWLTDAGPDDGLAMAFWTESPGTAVLLSATSLTVPIADLVADVRAASEGQFDDMTVEAPDDIAGTTQPEG
jgi:hypothetical protein